MTKIEAIELMNQNNYMNKLNTKNTHYSNIVKYANNDGWWVNVPFEKFSKDLNLILNNSKDGKFVYIRVKENSIPNPKTIFRNKDGLADIFIPLENEEIFIDKQYSGTGYNFTDYLIYDYNKKYSFKEEENFEEELKKSKNDTKENRLNRIKNSVKKPSTIEVISIQYRRNPDVIVEVLERANGICERCKKPAPFIKRKDKKPYLEVHHKIRLADNGDDSIENAIAICPNCHRELHYA